MQLLCRSILVASLLICALPARLQATPPAPDAGIAQTLPVQVLKVESGRKIHRFKVMMAQTPAEQEVGMMWRLSVGPMEGMLFPFPKPRPAAFWMRNTLIPLDIIFLRKNGRIANIAANATPQSLDPIPSAGPVAAVLEIGGGRAAALGIKPGDRVRWSH